LIGVDDKIAKILWSKRFLEWQEFMVKLNIIYQDNTSTIKLEENGKESSRKRTQHFKIKYFYVTDLVGRDEVKIKYCSTDEMIADYSTKPVVGRKFVLFRDRIMNLSGNHHCIEQQECVGRTEIKRKVKLVDSEEKESNESLMTKKVRIMSRSAKPGQCLR
jgi:hypothetical protein